MCSGKEDACSTSMELQGSIPLKYRLPSCSYSVCTSPENEAVKPTQRCPMPLFLRPVSLAFLREVAGGALRVDLLLHFQDEGQIRRGASQRLLQKHCACPQNIVVLLSGLALTQPPRSLYRVKTPQCCRISPKDFLALGFFYLGKEIFHKKN